MELFKHLTRKENLKVCEAVEKELERYRTSKYYEPHKGSEEERILFHRKVEEAVDHLPKKEKLLIVERYLHPESDYIRDNEVYNLRFEPPISHMTYYSIRDAAMIKIALFLNLDTGIELDF